MPLVRKRRAPAADEASEDEHTPQRRRGSPQSEAEDNDDATQADHQLQQMAKKLGRKFKAVFAEAQLQLRVVFGMQMTELTRVENTTIRQRQQAAQRAEKQANTATNAWVLTSTLPEKYRRYDIIPPPKVPTFSEESAYVGIYSFVVACITLSGGKLPDAKLDRFLKRANIDQTTPIGTWEKVSQRMKKDGYIKEVQERLGDETVKEWVVAGRGLVELGKGGVAGMVQAVYAKDRPQDLDRKLERSLKLTEIGQASTTQGTAEAQNGAGRGRGRLSRQEQRDGEPEETDEE
ncbi:hypothetical protein SLS56_003738 [Neofusicoccum ribis]|uniref:MAGE domain-containing protein n=1 Tax=Neofusicoccum ribis TaxID=45134 RepID=A0ABR3SYA4_9PEZI